MPRPGPIGRERGGYGTRNALWHRKPLEKFGGSPSKLAAAIDGEWVKVTRQHVEHWRKTGKVPASTRRPDVQRVSGVPVELPVPWRQLGCGAESRPAAVSRVLSAGHDRLRARADC